MRKILYILLFILPLAVGGSLGYYAGLYLSNFNTAVALAVEIKDYQEALSKHAPPSPEDLSVDAQEFLKTPAGQAADTGALYEAAGSIKRKFGFGGIILGAWLAVVFFLKSLNAVRGRKYEIREPDPQLCVSCGRCFKSCPVERERLKKESMKEKEKGKNA
jgi:NosR/NirI family transcriptional regulator, nitrous oxide reductase regulator